MEPIVSLQPVDALAVLTSVKVPLLSRTSVELSVFFKDMPEESTEFGPQPLDAIMVRLGLTNHALVAASADQLTHKMVAKGRKGRKLTPNAQNKILAALRSARPKETFKLRQLFNYY